ncbi:TIGR04500 family putative peptide maturation system protein [Sorangium sp. So ce131]|uniref:TIGR04500 family putative peptide maturation system protein n=1 Tax=Sorangium sp. So ce131 TaxID=3133282 RepID=UPI003F60A696
MNSEVRQTTIHVLDELVRLSEERVAPREGAARLKQLARGRAEPGAAVKLDVLWEEESGGGAVHYDALIRLPGWGAVSVGYCPDRGLPWAMRGTFRWSEMDMLRVNHRYIRVDEVVAQLDFLWTEPSLARQLVDAALIAEALEEDPDVYAPSDEELQVAMDSYRRRRNLLTAAATERWLEQQGMTHRSFEGRIDAIVRGDKLRRRVVGGREEAYFASHEGELDTAVLARIALADLEGARALGDRLRSGELDLLGAAAEALRQRRPAASRWEGPPPLLSRVRRWELPPERRAAVFDASPGAVLGPVETEAGLEIQQLVAVEPAVLDAATRAAIRDRLFEEWLAERRAAADVAWLWGRS